MNYKVDFFKIEYKQNDKGKLEKTGKDNHLGAIEVDDNGTSNSFTLLAKAFRMAHSACNMADKTIITRLN